MTNEIYKFLIKDITHKSHIYSKLTILKEKTEKNLYYLNRLLEIIKQNHSNKKIKELANLKLENWYFAGGCIRDIFSDRTPKDYDLFFSDKEVCENLKTIFYEEDIEDFLNEYLLFWQVKIEKSKIGNIDIHIIHGNESTVLQLCIMSSMLPMDMISTFDFTINQSYLDDENFVIAKDIVISNPKLVANDTISWPTGALMRIDKFKDMGYKPDTKTYETIVSQMKQKFKTKASSANLKPKKDNNSGSLHQASSV